MRFGCWTQFSLHFLTPTFYFDLGFVKVRATHGACEGTWFYEAKIEHLGTSGHVRLGWSTRKGELQAPVSIPTRLHLLNKLLFKSPGIAKLQTSEPLIVTATCFLQVGYDEYSFAYRDLEGVKVSSVLRDHNWTPPGGSA